MATYKQKLPRVHHVSCDTEELSGTEQEWVMFNASNKPIERRLVNNVSDDEDWHVLSDTSLVEEVAPSFESNSEFASGCSEYDSEPYYVQDKTARSIELLPEGQDNSPSFIRNMPSHDGTGNFFDTTFSDGSNYDSSTSHIDSNLARRYHDQDNESLSSDLKGSVISDKTSQDHNSTRCTNTLRKSRNSIRESWITKFRNVFRIEEEIASAINLQEQTTQTSQIYHKFAESASSAAKFELGDLGNTNPIKSYSNVGNENANSNTYTTVTTQYVDTLPNQSSQTNYLKKLPASMSHIFDSSSSASSASSSIHTSNVVNGPLAEKHASIITRFGSRLIVPKDPMSINFAPTISKDMLNEMIATENVNSADHQNQQSSSSQSDKNSLLSTVWTTFCRITNNIIVSDDTDPVPSDPSHSTSLAFASSNHNTHSTGLASIITGTGENHYTYETCYLPFGNHLTLSELCPSLHNYKSHYSSSSTPSTPSCNTTKIFLTPVSSSTSLKSFTSRAGSDCGLESGRGMGKSTTLGAPLVL